MKNDMGGVCSAVVNNYGFMLFFSEAILGFVDL
jgi:hypothetical protein